jgi:hypothetical protein
MSWCVEAPRLSPAEAAALNETKLASVDVEANKGRTRVTPNEIESELSVQ